MTLVHSLCVSDQFNISTIILSFYVYQCSLQLVTASKSWDDHNLAATAMDCNLASITSAEEQAMAINKLSTIGSFVWLGGRYIGTQASTAGLTGPDNWMWTDGSAFVYEKWGPNAPAGNGECMKFKPQSNSAVREWNDEDCTKVRPALYKCCGR